MGKPHTKKPKQTHEFVQAVAATLGPEAIQVLDPTQHGSKEQHHQPDLTGVKLDFVPPCRTQVSLPKNLSKLPKEGGPLSIFVGLFGTIPRWIKGSVIKWAAYAGGYPAPADAVYAAQQLNAAGLYWNSLNVGVTFLWVGNLDDAEFVLGYGGDQGNVVASSFFPNANDLNHISVDKRAFDTDTKPYMWRFFLHELGHVLGLRHEFSMDPKPGSNPTVPIEGGAIQLGPRDPLSVMNYRADPPTITQSDIDTTRAFYGIPGGNIGVVPLQLFVPDN